MDIVQPVFRVRIIYKHGHVQDFDCTRFVIRGSDYEWTAVGDVHPVKLGVDDIAAVWTIGKRYRLNFWRTA